MYRAEWSLPEQGRNIPNVSLALTKVSNWLDSEVSTMLPARLLIPQQATFAGRCPLSCRFRPLYLKADVAAVGRESPKLTQSGHSDKGHAGSNLGFETTEN